METLLSQLSATWEGLLVITGDMNIDMKNPDNPNTIKYQSLLDIFNLTQMINLPTRVTPTSSTIIDHIITNQKSRITHTGVIPCSIISDHDGPYACINIRSTRYQPRFKYIRNLKTFDEQSFINDFSNLPFNIIECFDDPDDQLDCLNNLVKECIDRHAPLRKTKVTRPPAPWLGNEEIRSLQDQRNKLRKEAHSTGSETAWESCRYLRNKLKTLIRRAKHCFYQNALSSKKPREVWKIIHRILKPNPQPLRFEVDSLNKYFADIPTRITDAQPTTKEELQQLIHDLPENGSIDDQFALETVTSEEVYKVIKSLKSDCSTGPDLIPAKFVKLSAEYLAVPLTNIINTCITKSQFPEVWKKARISPVPKIDPPISEGHLRPISILPVLSKIFEKLVAKQMTQYIEVKTVMQDTIGGFRKGHSTTTLLLGIRDDLLHAMKRGEVTLMVLADFSKAFDTICFKTILTKLHKLEFSKSFLTWIINYLSNRSHYVQIDDRKSTSIQAQFGIPQGSILGPMLFNIYVNDLQDNLPEHIKSFQYADDTTIYTSCPPNALPHHTSALNDALNDIGIWSKMSNLALNPDKTKYMLVSTSQMARVHNLQSRQSNLEITNIPLERVSETKLLGVHMHENLKWEEHVKQITTSCYGVLRILRKIKFFTDFRLKRQLTESLILLKLDYCDTVFYPIPEYLLHRLQKVQYASANFVLGHYVNSISDIVKLGWLPIRERRDWHLLQHVHKALHNAHWPSFLKLDKKTNTRVLRSGSATRLTVPLVTGTFQDSAAKLFNILPSDIRDESNFNIFRNQCKSFLMNKLNQ